MPDSIPPSDDAPKMPKLPHLLDACDLLASPPPEPHVLIDSLLRQGEKMMLGGTSKSNKTWTLLDLAVSVASGTHWIGFKCVKSLVIYVNLELPGWSITGRIKAIIHAKRAKLDRNSLALWNLRGTVVNYKTLIDQASERLSKTNCGLIILDPIYKMLNGSDENAAGDIGKLMNQLEELAARTKAAVAFAAHYAKGNAAMKDPIDRVSGSGVFARDPDTICNLTAHREEGSWTINTILRNSAPVDPFVVTWEYPLMARNEMLDPDELKSKKGVKSHINSTTLLSRLGKRRLTTTQWYKECQEEDGIQRSRFYSLLAKLREAGHVAKGDDGCWESTLEDGL